MTAAQSVEMLGKISGDTHINEPRTLWTDNLPAAMRDQALRGIAAGDDGGWTPILDGAHAGKAGEDEAHRLKMLDPQHRYEIMRHEGVVGECVFPTIGLYVWMLEDQAGCEASCRVYNEFIADGLARSRRFKCAGLVPTWTLEGALRSLYRSYEARHATYEATLAAQGEPPPVMIVVCPNTVVSKLVFDWIAGRDIELADGSTRLAAGNLPLLSNVDGGSWTTRQRTILVDSAQWD